MMRLATSNQDVIRRANTQIHTAQRSLSYFEETLRQLQARKQQSQGADGSNNTQISPGGFSGQYSSPKTNRMPDDRSRLSPIVPGAERDGANKQNTTMPMDDMPKAKNYTALGSWFVHHHRPSLSVHKYPRQIWSRRIPLSPLPRYLRCFTNSSSNFKWRNNTKTVSTKCQNYTKQTLTGKVEMRKLRKWRAKELRVKLRFSYYKRR